MSRRAVGSQYFLDEQIGRGGMGTVWRGQDRTTGASYAIKVLNESLATDPSAVARFVRERTALISFRHPHVVTLHDMIVERDTLALVMDLIPGGDLNRLRRDHGGRLELHQALELTAQVADALAAAHAAGIVHRDIKPGNILLRAGDDALLADFGIAHLAAQSRETTTGIVLGTAEYLAPELLAGEDPGPEGDLYALGVTLYELITGAPPFTGHPAAVLHAHVANVPSRPPGMDDGLWEVISLCLEKDPARRPSAGVLASVLRGLAAPGPSTLPGQAGLTGRVAGQYGLSRPFHQVRMQPLPETAQPRARAPRRSVPRPSRTVMTITASVVAVAALIAAVAIVNPFASSAAKTTGDTVTAPTVTGGATTQAASPAVSSSLTGKKQQGAGAQATNGTGAGPSKAAAPSGSRAAVPSSAAHPSSAAAASASAAHPSSGAATSSSAAATAGTTDANGYPILNASSSQDVHQCKQLGIDRRGYQAMVCFDIDTSASGGNYYATGKVEAYCQTIAGAAAQCLHITLGGLYTEGVSGTQTQESWTCGGTSAACPNGRWVQTLATFQWSGSNSSNCSNGTSPANDVLDEVVGVTTQIELPVSDATYTLNAGDGGNAGDNYSSGHYWVCQS